MNKVLIINPFSSPAYLSKNLKQLGIQTTALYTIPEDQLRDFYKPDKDLFDQTIINDSTLDIAELKQLNIDYIINGAELSLHTTEQLTNILTPNYSNNPEKAAQRMNKFVMHETLAKHGLEHIKQLKFCPQINSIEKMAESIVYPCFIKPNEGAGSIGAKKVENHTQLRTYFSNNNFDSLPPNSNTLEFLISQYIEGTEYFIDSFSYKGIHYISAIQKYTKKLLNGIPTYCYWEVETSLPIIEHITQYIKSVLSTLELDNGFAHSEIFLQPNGNPVLIEVNPRIGGAQGMTNYTADLAGYPTQVELLANLVFNIPLKPKVLKPKAVRLLFLFNFKNDKLPDLTKKLSNFSGINLIRQLKPVGFIKDNVKEYTVLDAVAFVVCYNEDLAMLEKTCQEILSCDEQGW